MQKKKIMCTQAVSSTELSAGKWQYKDSCNKIELPVLKKMYKALCSAKTPEEHEKMLYAWDEVFCTMRCENDPALASLYNWCTARAIEEIKAYKGRKPRLWKFYSSGVIVKSGGIVRAFDLNCGCELEAARTGLRFSPENIRKLAGLIDEYYVTHAHVDHIGIQLVDALVKNKKKIIANSDTIQKWFLTTAQDSDQLKSPGYHCFPSFQRIGTLNLPNTAFVLNLAEGCTILVKGDIYMGSDVAALCNWLEKKKLMVDYAVVSIFTLNDPNILPEIKRRFNSTVIPVHEWEFGHRAWDKAGPATQTYADIYAALRKQKLNGFPLMWGESVELPPRKG